LSCSFFFGSIVIQPKYISGTIAETKKTLTEEDLISVDKILSGEMKPKEMYKFFKGLNDEARKKLFSALDGGFDPKEFLMYGEWFKEADAQSPDDRDFFLLMDEEFFSLGKFTPRDDSKLEDIIWGVMDTKQAYEYLRGLSEKERQEALKYLDKSGELTGFGPLYFFGSESYNDLASMSDQERKDMYAREKILDKLQTQIDDEKLKTLTEEDLISVDKILSGEMKPKEMYKFFKGLNDEARKKLFSALDGGFDPKEFLMYGEWFKEADAQSPEDRDFLLLMDEEFFSLGKFTPRDDSKLEDIIWGEMDTKQAYEYLRGLSEKERQEALKYLDKSGELTGFAPLYSFGSESYNDLASMSDQERKDMYAREKILDKLRAVLSNNKEETTSSGTDSNLDESETTEPSTETTTTSSNLTHGVVPTKVTGQDNIGVLEFWNVGKLGGKQYSKATYTITWEDPDSGERSVIVAEGYFTGGPNGKLFLSLEGQEMNGRLVDGKVAISDQGGETYIDNPEAFDGWVD